MDRNAHEGKPFLQWYLEQMKGFDQRHRLRLVDIVDIHAYVTQITDNADSASQVHHINSTAQRSTVLHSTVQHSTEQNRTVEQYSTVQYSTYSAVQ